MNEENVRSGVKRYEGTRKVEHACGKPERRVKEVS